MAKFTRGSSSIHFAYSGLATVGSDPKSAL
jgi:hypothetical protein